MMRWRSLWCIALVYQSVTTAQNISADTLALVQQRLAESANHSWELGTRTQALLDFTASQYSVFNQASAPNIPPPAVVPAAENSSLSTIMSIARSVVNARNATPGIDYTTLFPKDTSAGDPASMGVAVLLANWTNAGGADYATAAAYELNYLLIHAPRSDTGAISHRTEQVQLWSDSVFMVPPFLAYYGAITNNQSLLTEAYNQCHQYHDALLDTNKSAGGLWHHIVLGNGTDAGHWSTGNGWAALGMLRVYATLANSQFSNVFKSELGDLANWVNEILDGMYANLDQTSGLFRNYVDDPNSFLDGSSTAIIAAATYRNALLTGQVHHLPNAEQSRKALAAAPNGTPTHFDSDGWLTPVVNPLNVGVEGSKSPEGQAFVLLMQSAYDDWVKAGSFGANAAIRIIQPPHWILLTLTITFFLSIL